MEMNIQNMKSFTAPQTVPTWMHLHVVQYTWMVLDQNCKFLIFAVREWYDFPNVSIALTS